MGWTLSDHLASFPEKPPVKKCAAKACRKGGWFVCRGGCGRGYCGHHARGPVKYADTRAAVELRGTCVCYTCDPHRSVR